MATGECATVGIAGGLAQGGGHSPLTNQQGFLADTALEFKAITADGKLVTANADTNADLFWALRGGGPAAFAVIVEATYKTFVDPPSSAINLDITLANTGGSVDLLWAAIAKFHSYGPAWIAAGLYVYYEIFGPSLRVHHINRRYTLSVSSPRRLHNNTFQRGTCKQWRSRHEQEGVGGGDCGGSRSKDGWLRPSSIRAVLRCVVNTLGDNLACGGIKVQWWSESK
jgi:hypothetical protein